MDRFRDELAQRFDLDWLCMVQPWKRKIKGVDFKFNFDKFMTI